MWILVHKFQEHSAVTVLAVNLHHRLDSRVVRELKLLLRVVDRFRDWLQFSERGSGRKYRSSIRETRTEWRKTGLTMGCEFSRMVRVPLLASECTRNSDRWVSILVGRCWR